MEPLHCSRSHFPIPEVFPKNTTHLSIFHPENKTRAPTGDPSLWVLYLGQRIAIGIHGGHQVYVRAVDQLAQFGDPFVVPQEILGQVDQELSTHRFVAMHIGNVLDGGREEISRPSVP